MNVFNLCMTKTIFGAYPVEGFILIFINLYKLMLVFEQLWSQVQRIYKNTTVTFAYLHYFKFAYYFIYNIFNQH